MKRAEVNRRLGKIERAFEKAIDAGELPGGVSCPSGTRPGSTRSTTWLR